MLRQFKSEVHDPAARTKSKYFVVSGQTQLSQELGLSCYFANPYHSWKRRVNEHTNGLLRQFFPKRTNFRLVEPEALKNAVTLINDRPRESLDYQMPSEVFYADKSDNDALQI